MKNLAIIPARSGSKGLKDKNIKLLAGLPLIAHSIICAQKSGIFDVIHVSTDSENYAEIAKDYGASVLFLRKPELSTDTASTWDVVISSLAEFKTMGHKFDTVSVLQPTSPLRIAKDIQDGYALYEEKNANAVVSVSEMEHSPLWCNKLDDSLSLDNFIPKELINKGRQQLEKYYRINGALYIVDTNFLDKTFNLFSEKCYAYIMPQERSVDIDSGTDFKLAEMLLVPCID